MRNKNVFFYLSASVKNCIMSGKSQGISRWVISGNPEQNHLQSHYVDGHFWTLLSTLKVILMEKVVRMLAVLNWKSYALSKFDQAYFPMDTKFLGRIIRENQQKHK